MHISVIYMEDGIKPLIWEGCRMQTVQAGKEKYHAIVCKRDGIKMEPQTGVPPVSGTGWNVVH